MEWTRNPNKTAFRQPSGNFTVAPDWPTFQTPSWWDPASWLAVIRPTRSAPESQWCQGRPPAPGRALPEPLPARFWPAVGALRRRRACWGRLGLGCSSPASGPAFDWACAAVVLRSRSSSGGNTRLARGPQSARRGGRSPPPPAPQCAAGFPRQPFREAEPAPSDGERRARGFRHDAPLATAGREGGGSE